MRPQHVNRLSTSVFPKPFEYHFTARGHVDRTVKAGATTDFGCSLALDVCSELIVTSIPLIFEWYGQRFSVASQLLLALDASSYSLKLTVKVIWLDFPWYSIIRPSFVSLKHPRSDGSVPADEPSCMYTSMAKIPPHVSLESPTHGIVQELLSPCLLNSSSPHQHCPK